MSKVKIFDAHLHIIDPRFPLTENQGYLPPAFTASDYVKSVEDFEVTGGAIVSGSFQSFDQSYLLDALDTLGDRFVGVTQLPADTSDEEILKLHEKGVRAVRFNVKRGGSETIEQLDRFARRVHDIAGWNAELYIDSKDLGELKDTINQLPSVSIDHLGLSNQGFPELLKLVEQGVKVKATGFGRIDFDPAEAIRMIHALNSEALLFGTDLPSTRADTPFQASDVTLIQEALGDNEAEKVLHHNALKWYGIE
ncbi:amidohydrolase family protein [Planococcus sp. CP5-4]|uniref:amidohydrolase family protein n=1 Tax=unclassified Planococcus (in: firmicutes) TaxID=2662419 RepID=UPI001C21A06C|nr:MULTISPECIES: amidohydrolase family protein [unclassified Planococcus (in: firmicutes)]MBU9673650.1 amidohydrolase family protein [Planococcus sp. CP5-4_YE]MBV0907940.1 amidohydrolase family protein [Planococcus sp. CP5-4_UN]MBW6063107.1 amidohydrolase family protein [Planococcus sp. CP5-4]